MAATRMCANCNVLPVHGNFNYCGRTCASAYAKNPPQATTSPPVAPVVDQRFSMFGGWPGQYPIAGPSAALVPMGGGLMCHACGMFPKAGGFDVCSKVCLMTLYQQQLMGGSTIQIMGGGMGGPMFYQAPQASLQPAVRPCRISGCRGFEASPGEKYCSTACKKASVAQGLEFGCYMCKTMPKWHKSHFCGKSCKDDAESKAPLLLEVPTKDPKYIDVSKQFTATWQAGYLGAMTVKQVYKVVNTKATEQRFQSYRQTVEARGKFTSSGKTAGNENRRWHGTYRACTIGDSPANLTPCAAANCIICSVIKNSFDTKYTVRCAFGGGIYSSAYSSTSHGYTRAATPGSANRALFLNRVVAGNVAIIGQTPGFQYGAKAPPGFDSLATDPKHNELIVFQNDAICPSWLVIYG